MAGWVGGCVFMPPMEAVRYLELGLGLGLGLGLDAAQGGRQVTLPWTLGTHLACARALALYSG